MAEEKDAAELAAEKEEGEEIPPLPPIPPQITPSNGEPRRTQREAGEWLKANNVEPPPGSFTGEEGYGAASAPTAPPASTEKADSDGEDSGGGRGVKVRSKKTAAKKSTTKKSAAKKTES
jgi:phospholipid/cholesterol/gamma-HCH transport system ATP-binding protein